MVGGMKNFHRIDLPYYPPPEDEYFEHLFIKAEKMGLSYITYGGAQDCIYVAGQYWKVLCYKMWVKWQLPAGYTFK